MSSSEPDAAPLTADSKPRSRLVVRLIGLVVFVAAVASVFLIDWTKEIEELPPVVRPIKTTVIKDSFAARGRTYPGQVSAGQQVDLSFEVSGNIIQQLVVKGDRVTEGELLMRLDDRDYVNQYKAAIAERDRAQAQFERVEKAAASGAVSKQEVDNARAAFDQAAANVSIKEKARKDTELRAKYTGVIGDVFVKQFQTVQAKQKILSLIDLATIEIDVSVPESTAALADPKVRSKTRFVAIFDYYAGEKFDVTIKEFATQADPATQTYTVTVEMPRPKGRNLLPGMTATVLSFMPPELLGPDAEGFPVRLDAVPVDGQGQYFVWKLKETGRGTYTVHRADVTIGEIVGDDIVVREGLAKGDRIALAGVHVLNEGREVRLLSPEEAAKLPDGGAPPAGAGTDDTPGQ